MSNLMDAAIEALRHVPLENQVEVARMVMQLAAVEQLISELSPEEQAELAESEAAADRGEFATDVQVRAIWAKYGL